MCLYPTLIRNRKYTITKKNKGNVPKVNDERTKYVTIGCGKCMECVKKKSRDWKIRLSEEIRTKKTGKFVTLTFSEESLNKFNEEFKDIPEQARDNEIATRATRLFLERWRKKYKKSVKHWLITEKGHNGTERIHLHGIIFTHIAINDEGKPYDTIIDLEEIWQYGWIYIGQWVNDMTINYIMKYVTKIDLQHKWFTGKILCSPGIGANYINRKDSKNNAYKEKTNEMYTTRSGRKLPLPIYYRNKIYSDDEREKLWLSKLDEETRYVCGEKVDVSTNKGEEIYEKLREYYRGKNTQLGYGTIDWKSEVYKKNLRNIKKLTTLAKKKQQVEKSAKKLPTYYDPGKF